MKTVRIVDEERLGFSLLLRVSFDDAEGLRRYHQRYGEQVQEDEKIRVAVEKLLNEEGL